MDCRINTLRLFDVIAYWDEDTKKDETVDRLAGRTY